ncbi:MAG: MASE1 domain-containing protein [Chthoniobacterales bacterium]
MKDLPQHILRTLLLAGMYVAAGWFGLTSAALSGYVSPFWPPAGLALCFLLLQGWKTLPGIVLGVVTAAYFRQLPWTVTATIALGNTLEAVVAYLFLIRLAKFHLKLDRSRDVVALAFSAALAPIIAATLGTLAAWLAQKAEGRELASVWTTWWSGDVLGILVVAPLILSWWKPKREPLSRNKIVEILALGIGLTVVCRAVFNFGGPVSDSALAFLTFPFLLWAALRFGMRGAATASALVCFVAIQSVAAFSGPFRVAAVVENVWILQTFQVVSSLSALLVASLISERIASNLALHTSELRLHETQKYESLGIMAGGIAHDFNNLLTAVMGNAELLKLRLPGNPLVEEHTGEIEKAGRKASELCQQMVAFSGYTVIADVAVNLNDWLEKHLAAMTPVLPRQIRVQTVFSPEVLQVNIQPDQLLQVFQNLIDNSVEAYHGRSGLIEVETGIKKIDDANSRHNLPSLQVPAGSYVYFTVRDNGEGMSDDIKDRIFEPFFTTKFTGRGLGLAFVLGIVRAHQGTLQVVSQRDKGTEITILLPVRTLPEQTKTLPAAPALERTSEAYLMVDDDDLVREITVQLLRETGAKVFSASNGIAALDIYQAEVPEIDVVIIDWIMPGMTGFEVARAIRSIKPDQPIVLTSGFTNEEVSLELPGTGKTTFLPKPFTTKDIMVKVREVMS